MKRTEIRSQNVQLLFNILGSNREPDPYSKEGVALHPKRDPEAYPKPGRMVSMVK